MAKSQQSFNKKEREKKQKKRRQEKLERREQRKVEKEEQGKLTLEEQFSYVDEDGNLTSTPPDPTKRRKIKAEDIILDNSPNTDPVAIEEHFGMVKFFNQEKGFGFIIDSQSGDSVFAHSSNIATTIKENDKVSFILEMGPKGTVATRVKLIAAS
ncbi:MAG: cold shock domain-containing protein [Saprospiraceae bacterium]|nr:cold shock domain-containing protein [Saprospiraceae bacterium]